MISHKFDFGDNKDLAEKLKKLVLSGKKTATTSLYNKNEKVPKAGEYAEILDSDKKHFCVVQYIDVEIKNFLDVNFDFIQKEGEGDKNIEEWREKHRKFFSLNTDDVLVVCEEFKLILNN